MFTTGLAALSQPDTLTLKDGSTVSGTLVARRDGAIWFRHKVHGLETVKVYSEDSIQSVELGSTTSDEHNTESDESVEINPPTNPINIDEKIEPVSALKAQDMGSVRSQWRDLMPYATMNNPLYLVELNVITVAEAYARIGEYATYNFDAHPVLSSVGPGLMRYLAENETRVIPILRSTATPMDAIEDPEGTLGSLFVELMSRQMENNVLLAWQNEYDEKVRQVQKKLWPLTKEISGPIDQGSGAIQVGAGPGGRPGLLIHNTLGMDLTDVAIKIVMETLDGRSSVHYFYLDEWESEASFYPRPAADWIRVGPKGTTHGAIEICAAEVSLPIARFDVPENVEWTVRNVVEPMIARSPTPAIRALAAAKQRSGNDIELNKLIYDLREYAKDHKAAIIKRLEERKPELREEIKKLKQALNSPERPGRLNVDSDFAEKFKDTIRQMIESKEAQLDAIDRELRELKSPVPLD